MTAPRIRRQIGSPVGMAGIAAALGIGGVLPLLPSLAAILLACVIPVVALLVLAHNTLGWKAARSQRTHASATVIPQYAIPRALFYLGLLFIGQLTWELPLQLSLSDWLFFGAAILTIVELVRQNISGWPFHALAPFVLLGGLLFGLGGLLATASAELPLQSALITARFEYMVIVWFGVAAIILQSVEHVRTAIVFWAGSAALNGGAAIAQFLYGDIVPGSSPYWGRMTGFTPHMNELGGTAAVSIVPVLLLATTATQRSTRVFGTVCFLASGAGLLLSGSVGALAAGMTAIIFWYAVRGLTGMAILGVLAAGLSIALIASFQSAKDAPTIGERLQRVSNPEGGEDATFFSRLETYEQTIRAINDEPLLGRGLDDESTRTNVIGDVSPPTGGRVLKGLQPHNVFLLGWYGAGLLGFAGLLLLYGASGTIGLTNIARARNQEEWLVATALTSSFLALFVYALSSPLLYQRYGWASVALLIALRGIRIRTDSSTRPTTQLTGAKVARPDLGQLRTAGGLSQGGSR